MGMSARLASGLGAALAAVVALAPAAHGGPARDPSASPAVASSVASQASSLRRFIPTSPGVPLPRTGGEVNSLNWSGYVVAPSSGGVTGVSGSWVVPAVQQPLPGFSATWVGIGGYAPGDTSLIQAGTEQDNLLGGDYYAWYELLPNSETPITGCDPDPACTVEPGDRITVDITEIGSTSSGQTWSISIVDQSSTHAGWTWGTPVVYASSEASAEWILEAPSLVAVPTVLAHVGTVTFDPNDTFTVGNGSPQPLGQGSPTEVALTDPTGLLVEAQPSGIDSDADGFNVCSWPSAPSCPVPSS